MRTLRMPIRLVLIPLAAVGCSGVSGGRSGLAPQIKTITSIGDKPQPVVSGTPGEKVVADRDEPPRRTSAEERISGRVIDVRGNPVPNARVRLAASGATGGKLVRATTDKAGGFTLHGLRPGASYTVIAEADDPQGVLTGRSQVQVPDTQVRIRLRDLEDAPISAGSGRVSPVSNRDDTEESDAEAERPGRVNEEDLPPPPEAEAFVPSHRTRRPMPKLGAPVPGSGWRRGDAVSESGNTTTTALTDPPGPAARVPAPGDASDDEGPNPLPPAIEPARNLDAPDNPATRTNPPTTAASTPVPPRSTLIEPQPTPASGPGLEPTAPAIDDRPAPDAAAPGPTPAAEADTSPSNTSVAARPRRSSVPGGLAESRDDPPAPASPPPLSETAPWPVDRVATTENAGQQGASGPQTTKRPTWADLSVQHPELLTMAPASVASLTRAASPPTATDTTRTRPTTGRTRLASTAGDPNKAMCQYDTRHRQLIDFRLPDLEGKPVQFQDLNAEFVLLDFWGTWCAHCANSIPHLVELQKLLGPQRLKVVGIAYEDGPVAERAAKVAATARRLGINYTLLLGGLDVPCPLQDALHVQAYPTMVLLDRDGHLIWRDTGATPATLARLDRVLATTTRADIVRR